MSEYGQFCAIARAAEVVGERWTLLILRELSLGPKRFSDLKGRLDPISPGVLNGRLRALTSRGVIAPRLVPPPTPARLYELTEAGHALRPALFELLRWGSRYLFPQRRGERFEPEWLRMVLQAYASQRPGDPLSLAISIRDNSGMARPVALVARGQAGVEVSHFGPAQAEITASPVALLGLMSGRMTLDDAEQRDGAAVSGDRDAASRVASLFEAGA